MKAGTEESKAELGKCISAYQNQKCAAEMGGDPTQYESNEYAAAGELQNQNFAKADVGNLGNFRILGRRFL
ncbi:MAG: hypothetical protein OXC63_01315 [Aestuariivita sp.]|nr:hypothetical protein [Aestuariivita sp.]MCY4348067.1 hypothetical protein [Aestuariivita sp.]